MKKNIYLAILAIALLVLATPSQAQPPCADSTTLTLLVSKYQLNLVDKAPVCISLASPAFAIRVVVAGNLKEMGDVTVGQKETQPVRPVTITGKYDSSTNTVVVTVDSNNMQVEDEFDYFINVEGVGILDPRIRIIP